MGGISVQEIIDLGLKPKEEHARSGKMSPSQFGGCYRKQYWHRLDIQSTNPPDNRTLRVFKAGNLFEEFVVKNMTTRYPDLQTQVKCETEDVLGFADIVNGDEVMDVKSVHSRKFWWNAKEEKEGKDIREIYRHNWMQVMFYAWTLNKSKARLIFVSKDDLCIAERVLSFCEYWQDELVTELCTNREYWEKKELPPAKPRLFGVDKYSKPKECGYCQFSDLCEKTEKERVIE